jgi:hypothetical protein
MKSSNPLHRRLFRSLAVPAAAGFIAFAAAASPALAAPPCGSSVASFASTNTAPSCWRPYDSGSPFNTVIPSNPTLSPNSGSEVANMEQYDYTFDGNSSSMQYTSDGSRPVYYATDSDPLVTINCTAYWGPNTCQGWNGIPIDNIQIHIPSGAQPESDWDHHMIVVDTTTDTEYDFERASWSSSNVLTVWSGSEEPLDGTGLGGGADAADFGLLGGTISAAQLASGTINHALAVSVPCTTGYVYPATMANGQPCSDVNQSPTNALPLGALLQLNMTPTQIAATHAPKWEQTIMTAMATYGMYANDTNGSPDPTNIEFENQDDTQYTSLGMKPQMADLFQSLGAQSIGSGTWLLDGVQIPVSKLRVIDPCVVQGTCPSSGTQSGSQNSPQSGSPSSTESGGSNNTSKRPANPDPVARPASAHEKKGAKSNKLTLRDIQITGARPSRHRRHRKHHRKHHSR